MIETSFSSAKEPSLGYYYQIRYSLFLLISDTSKNDGRTSIESLDDIVVEDADRTDLYQTKLHLKNYANLTDRSPDFWKTVRIWAEEIKMKQIIPEKTVFTLITTSKTSENSILHRLKNKENTNSLIKDLQRIAEDSSNVKNLKSYQAFLKLSESEQHQLIENMNIVDSALDFGNLKDKILKELRWSVTPAKIEPLYERVEGWWFNQCIIQLQNKRIDISFKELENQIYSISDKFRKDNLPIDFPEPIELSTKDIRESEKRTFVKQLKLIEIKSKTLRNAMSDYHRAYNQRSKWVREELLNPNEENEFDKRLFDDWKRKFDLLLDETEELPEKELQKKGRQFYEHFYVRNVPQVYIRERFRESYLVTGSCHILSDKKRIGWHPEYKNKL
jgi:hypothetical protein